MDHAWDGHQSPFQRRRYARLVFVTVLRRLLSTAVHLRLDWTSEGICSSNFLRAVAKAGVETICVSPESTSTPADVTPVALQQATTLRKRAASGLRDRGPVTRKLGALVAFASGFNPKDWASVEDWRDTICREVRDRDPDLVFVRGAGLNFDPHLAMLRSRLDIPWVANHHDPYPKSRYPEPYRSRRVILSRRQESVYDRVLAAADALTFPSLRLLKWMTAGRRSLENKSFVIPHVVPSETPEPTSLDPEIGAIFSRYPMVILHIGTLFEQRNPFPLITAFNQFLRSNTVASTDVALLFVGRQQRQIDTPHDSRNVFLMNQRVDYTEARHWMSRAVANVVLEADAPESPFFPLKLADALASDKAILGLTPQRSATSDMLGGGYPLLANPVDAGQIGSALEVLWSSWRDGTESELLPNQTSRDAVRPAAAVAALAEVFASLS